MGWATLSRLPSRYETVADDREGPTCAAAGWLSGLTHQAMSGRAGTAEPARRPGAQC